MLSTRTLMRQMYARHWPGSAARYQPKPSETRLHSCVVSGTKSRAGRPFSLRPGWSNNTVSEWYRDERLMQMPSDRKSKFRVRIAFLCLVVFIIVFSVSAYFVSDLGKLQASISALESRAALQGMTDAKEID